MLYCILLLDLYTVISVFTWLWCIQCAQIMRVILGPRARFGMALLAAAVCTSVWRMALWWLWSQTATLSQHRCVRGRESMYWMWCKKEPAAQRRSVVSFNVKFLFVKQSICSKHELWSFTFFLPLSLTLYKYMYSIQYILYCWWWSTISVAKHYPQILLISETKNLNVLVIIRPVNWSFLPICPLLLVRMQHDHLWQRSTILW